MQDPGKSKNLRPLKFRASDSASTSESRAISTSYSLVDKRDEIPKTSVSSSRSERYNGRTRTADPSCHYTCAWGRTNSLIKCSEMIASRIRIARHDRVLAAARDYTTPPLPPCPPFQLALCPLTCNNTATVGTRGLRLRMQ